MFKKIKKPLLAFLIIIDLIFFSCVGIYFYLNSQVAKLDSKYPVWNQKSKTYTLQTKRPPNWSKLKEIAQATKWAIIISEDWAFYDHFGLDLNQLKIVFNESLEAKRFVRGASTITQQVIKNSLLTSERSLLRKAQEMLMAILVEKKLSKDKILEIYLNLIELGPNIFGVKQASKFYFNKHPQNLSIKEAAFLAMLLPSPKRYSQSFRNKKLTPFAMEQVESILLKLRQAKVITEDQRLTAKNEDLSF